MPKYQDPSRKKPRERPQEVSRETREAADRLRRDPKPGLTRRIQEAGRAQRDYQAASLGVPVVDDTIKLSSGVEIHGTRAVPELGQSARNLIQARKNLDRQARVARDEPAVEGGDRPSEIKRKAAMRYGTKWHHSPDSYEDAGGPDAPSRKHYESSPTNYNASESPQRAGSARGSIQQMDGTDNKRANYRSKSARVPEPGSGSNHMPDVDSYNDTKDL